MKVKSLFVVFVFTILVCFFSACQIGNNKIWDRKDGLYFGQNFPYSLQFIVFATIRRDTAYVECYYPIKGQIFYAMSDTLIFKNTKDTVFLSKNSTIYSEDGAVYFKANSTGRLGIEETEISIRPESQNDYMEIKTRARPYSDWIKFNFPDSTRYR